MKYKELQAKAKELGLKYVGVSEDELKKSIKEASPKVVKPKLKKMETKDYSPEEKLPTTEEEVKANTDTSKEDKSSEENRDAVVYNGKHKVRTYTLEQHGKDYVKLAKQYISHPEREDYKVELERVENRIKCPHCGIKFRL